MLLAQTAMDFNNLSQVGMLVGAVVTLAGVVGFFFRLHMKCQSDRTKLWGVVQNLAGKFGYVIDEETCTVKVIKKDDN